MVFGDCAQPYVRPNQAATTGEGDVVSIAVHFVPCQQPLIRSLTWILLSLLQVDIEDISKVYSLFVDVKRSTQFLIEYQEQYMFNEVPGADEDEQQQQMMQQQQQMEVSS